MKQRNRRPVRKAAWPFYGWAGLALIAVFWPLNWLMEGLRTHWGFFPLWLGYILTVEGLTQFRHGNAFLTRKPGAFWALFVISAPFWWIFEFFNERTGYWIYTPIDTFSKLEYALYCTLNFSVVLPAVFSTTELMTTFPRIEHLGRGPAVGRHPVTLFLFFTAGWIMLAIVWIWPSYGAAFLWMSIYFILDPINFRSGRPSLLQHTAKGDWRLVLALWSGCLICGFFWEFWNYFSSPKWIYEVPFVDFWHLFEMPLLGYLGYLPFALELFALYALLSKWVPRQWTIFPGTSFTDNEN